MAHRALAALALSLALGPLAPATAWAAPPKHHAVKKLKQKRRPRPRPEAFEEERQGGGRVAREAWFYRQRAFPRNALPSGAMAAASRAWRDLAARTARPRAKGVADTVGGWTELGPAPLTPPTDTPNSGKITGRFRAIVVHPQNPSILYAGGAQAGIWKSLDGGGSWTAIGDALPSLAIGSLAIDPNSPETIYAGTGEDTFGYFGQGLLKSTDGGATWTQPAGTRFAGASITGLFIDAQSHAIYLSTSAGSQGVGDYCTSYYTDPTPLGLWRSDDGGATFQRLVQGGVTNFAVDVSATPRAIFYFALGLGASMLVEGSAPVPLPLPTATSSPSVDNIALAIAPSNPQVIYAGVGVGRSTSAIYLSQDHGATFAPLAGSPNYCYAQCDYTNAIAVHPTDPSTLYVAGGLCSIWKVTSALTTPVFRAVSIPNGDCGNNFANWYLHTVHPDAHAFAFSPTDPQTLYAVSDGGVVKTPDGGASWIDLNTPIGGVQFYGICIDPKNPGHVFGGSQDNGSSELSVGGWNGLITGDGGPCVAGVTDGSGATYTVISNSDAAVGLPDGSGVYNFSFDASEGCQGGPGCGDRTAFISPVVGDPSAPGTVYVGTYRLWRSTDGAASWNPASPDLTRGTAGESCLGGQKAPDVLTAIAVAPSASTTIYTGSASGRIFRTADGGTTWTSIDRPPLPGRWVSAIGVDPANPDRLYAAFSGFSSSTPTTPGHIFRSDDGGATWSARDLSIDMPVSSLRVHPVSGDLVYAGTDLGVMLTSDGGASWSPLPGLPNVVVYSLAFDGRSGTLVAGTHGRGVWSQRFAPTIAAAPTTLSLTVTYDAMTPPSASGTVAVSTADPSGSILNLSLSTDSPWLTASPTSGRLAGNQSLPLSVAAASAGLAIGEYDGKVVLTDPSAVNSPLSVPVHLSVVAAPPPPSSCGCRLGARAPSAAPVFALLALVIGLCASKAMKKRFRRARKST